MSSILYKKENKIARVILNRPEKLNAINNEMPSLLEQAIKKADQDKDIHVIVLSGNGKAFCGGYDLSLYAEKKGLNPVYQGKNWDPLQDYDFMWGNTQKYMSIWRSPKPVICKIHGFAVGGGSDIALCSDFIFMADNAKIGYLSTRVWGCPSTAMWVYRLGAEKAKRMTFTGDQINGKEAEAMGLILKSIPDEQLDEEVEKMANRLTSVPLNQLAMQKMVINQAVEASGLMRTQQLATLLDGVARHSPEGHNFKNRVETMGWRQAVNERDHGTFDWTKNKSIKKKKSTEND